MIICLSVTGQTIAFYSVFYTALSALLGFFFGMFFLWDKVILDLNSPKYSGPEDGLAWTPGGYYYAVRTD